MHSSVIPDDFRECIISYILDIYPDLYTSHFVPYGGIPYSGTVIHVAKRKHSPLIISIIITPHYIELFKSIPPHIGDGKIKQFDIYDSVQFDDFLRLLRKIIDDYEEDDEDE